MRVLRTPEERFAALPDFPHEPRYVETPGGLRMAYVESGKGDPILCLHGEPSWSFLYRRMIPILAERGRVVCPDLIGFGRSDKPAEIEDYTYGLHYGALEAFIKTLDLRRVTLVCQDWGGLLGLPLAADMEDRFSRLVVMNTGLPTGEETPTPGFLAWRNAAAKMTDMDVSRVIQSGCQTRLTPEIAAAYDAPFPSVEYKAGARKFPLLVPISPGDEAAPVIKRAKERLKRWTKPVFIAFSDKDPVTAGGDKGFRRLIPSAIEESEYVVRGAGHFLQEDKGEEIADNISQFLDRTPLA